MTGDTIVTIPITISLNDVVHAYVNNTYQEEDVDKRINRFKSSVDSVLSNFDNPTTSYQYLIFESTPFKRLDRIVNYFQHSDLRLLLEAIQDMITYDNHLKNLLSTKLVIDDIGEECYQELPYNKPF